MITISIIFSLLGLVIIIFIFLNLFCLWQARLYDDDDGENGNDEPKNCLKSREYHVRSYVGWIPRLKKFHRSWKNIHDFSLRRCWFNFCYCCQVSRHFEIFFTQFRFQELDPNQNFLDEIIIPPSVIISPAPLAINADKLRPNTLMIKSSSSGHKISLDKSPSPRRSTPKISILEPDPIVIPICNRHSFVNATPTPEDSQTVNFYAYQLEGKSGDKMLY